MEEKIDRRAKLLKKAITGGEESESKGRERK